MNNREQLRKVRIVRAMRDAGIVVEEEQSVVRAVDGQAVVVRSERGRFGGVGGWWGGLDPKVRRGIETGATIALGAVIVTEVLLATGLVTNNILSFADSVGPITGDRVLQGIVFPGIELGVKAVGHGIDGVLCQAKLIVGVADRVVEVISRRQTPIKEEELVTMHNLIKGAVAGVPFEVIAGPVIVGAGRRIAAGALGRIGKKETSLIRQ